MSLSGNKVIHEDGTTTYEPWATWTFKTIDGETITAKFTDAEISKMKKQYPQIKWVD